MVLPPRLANYREGAACAIIILMAVSSPMVVGAGVNLISYTERTINYPRIRQKIPVAPRRVSPKKAAPSPDVPGPDDDGVSRHMLRADLQATKVKLHYASPSCGILLTKIGTWSLLA